MRARCGGRGSLLEIQLGGRCIGRDAELPCRGLERINPCVVSIGMVFGLGHSVVCASLPPTCVPSASKTRCSISAVMGPAPCPMLHAVMEGGGAQKAAAFREVERKSSILVLFFWPCPGGCFLAAPEVSSGFFSGSLRAWRRPRAISSYRTLLVKVLLVCP